MERGDGRRKHLHVPARGSDDHHDRGARGHLHACASPDGSERIVDAADFVTGNNANILAPGEVLRKVDIPASALRKRHTHRRFTLTHLGRSTIFMIATQRPGRRRPPADDHRGHHPPGPPGVRFDAGRRCACTPHRRAARRRSGSTTPTAARTIDATSPGTTPRRSAPSSPREVGHDLHRERQGVRRGAEARSVPAHIRPVAGLPRRQEGLRRRRLRRLHGVARRRSGAQLHHPRIPRRGPRSHHDRGARHTGEPASDAAAVPGRSWVPVRVLHRGDDHDVGDLHRRAEAGPAARAEGKPLPLHRISRHRGRDQRCQRRRGRRSPDRPSAPASWRPQPPAS